MNGKNHVLAAKLRKLAETPPEPAELAATLVGIARALETQVFEQDSATAHESTYELEPYGFLVNTAKDAMTLVSRKYTYVAVNQAFRNLISPSLGDPVGLRVGQVWGEQNFERSIRPHLDRGLSGDSDSYELWLHPPGTERGYYHVSYTPYRDAKGEVTHVAVTTRDLTEWRHATDAARTSELLYRQLVENINEAIFTLDQDGVFSYVSPNVERMTGFSPSHYLHSPFTDHIHPDDLSLAKRTFEDVLSGGVPGLEFRCIKASGGYLWVRTNSSPAKKRGRTKGLIGTMVDITEERQARLALTRSERKYRDIFQNIQDAYFETDLDGIIREVSPSIRRVNDVPREQYIGRNARDFFANPQVFEEVTKHLLSYRQLSDLEIDLQDQGGQSLPCLVSAALVPDQEEGGFKIVGSMHDISALKQAEAENLQAKAFLENLVDTVPDPIYVKGEDHCWRMVNKAFAELLGLSKEQLYGKSAFDYFPADHAESFRAMDQQAFDQGGSFTHEEEFWDSGGVWHIISTNKAVFDSSEGSERLLVGVLRDITEQKRLEEILWHAKEVAESLAEAKSQFLANMSHEIRTPLNGVIGMLQLILTGELDSRQRDYADTAMNSARALLTVINDVLDLSKIEAGKMEIVKTQFDVREMVKSMVHSFSRASQGKDVVIEYTVAEQVPAVLLGGANRLRQVLFNLVGNALKFTLKGSVAIDVSWLPEKRCGEQRLLVCVEDTGVGIPDKSVEHIFDDFTQADESHTREFQGAGLGLSIVRRLVDLMGGAITIMSEEGKGTTVCFSIVVEESSGVAPLSPDRALTNDGALPFKLALVAEDNAVNQILSCRFLEKLGIEAVGVKNGKMALEELEKRAGSQGAYDLVLMDIQMPEMDGLEATKRIRASSAPGVADLPIVALTAHAMEGDRERFLALGMDGYTAKPMVLEDFKAVLDSLPGRNR